MHVACVCDIIENIKGCQQTKQRHNHFKIWQNEGQLLRMLYYASYFQKNWLPSFMAISICLNIILFDDFNFCFFCLTSIFGRTTIKERRSQIRIINIISRVLCCLSAANSIEFNCFVVLCCASFCFQVLYVWLIFALFMNFYWWPKNEHKHFLLTRKSLLRVMSEFYY